MTVKTISSVYEAEDIVRDRVHGDALISYGTGPSRGGIWTGETLDGDTYPLTPSLASCTPDVSPWSTIADFPVDEVLGTSGAAFAVSATTDDIYRHTGGTRWVRTGSPARDFVVAENALYGLSVDGTMLSRWNGDMAWTEQGGAMPVFSRLYGGSSGLFGTMTASYSPSLQAWDCFCESQHQPGWTAMALNALVAVGALSNNGDDVGNKPLVYSVQSSPYFGIAPGTYEYDFANLEWVRIGDIGDRVYAGGQIVYRQAGDVIDPLRRAGRREGTGLQTLAIR